MTNAAAGGKLPDVVLATPVGYIPHGKPDDILATLGLDATGITASIRAIQSLRSTS